MSNELVQYTVKDVQVMAEAAAKSGLFGMKSPEQAMALMLLCQAEGIHPMKAVAEYHIIQGRPALKADAMMARFLRAGGKVKWNRLDDKEVSATFSHPQGGEATISWTFEMGKTAGLTGKETWKQYPRQMLRSRVISEGVRTVFPGVADGIYTPEEVNDFDTKPPKALGKEALKESLKEEAPVVEALPDSPKEEPAVDGRAARLQIAHDLEAAVNLYPKEKRQSMIDYFLKTFEIRKVSELVDKDLDDAREMIVEMRNAAN